MRVLVTGAAGFYGRTIARHLVAAGCEVVAHRRSTPLPDDLAVSSAITDWQGDLNAIEALPDGIEAVVHAAATSPPTGRADAVPAEALIRDNALATARLVAASRAANVGRFVYLSSLSIHGTVAERSLDATTPVRDPDPYGVSKLTGESVLAASGFNGLAIRLPAVIGTGADRNWPVQVVGRIRRGETVRIYNADGLFNNVVHVDDLARWIVAVVTSSQAAPGFNAVPVASSEPIPVRVAVATLAAGLGLSARLEEVVAPRPSFLIETTAAEGLGFRPSSTVAALDRYARAPD
jgi:nucleoside-diphosphate-sugar epimerase